jgi:hypothetical protein
MAIKFFEFLIGRLLAIFGIFLIMNGVMAAQFVNESSRGQCETPDSILATTEIFSLGLNGFVGHFSDGELAYREILAADNAESRFEVIYKSDRSTTAAKLYCACGLKELASPMFQEIKQGMKTSDARVATMKGDVMRKEGVSEIMKRIDLFGCGDA